MKLKRQFLLLIDVLQKTKIFNTKISTKMIVCKQAMSTVQLFYESIRRGNFIKYLFLGVWSLGKSYVFLQNFEKTLLENLICSYGISFSWKILCVLTKFWTRSPGNFDLFLWYFLLLENRMCSCGILRKLSWKFWCLLVHFASLLESLYVFLYHFWFS